MNRFVYPGAISALLWFLAITLANAQDILTTGIQDFKALNGYGYGICGNMKTLCGCVYGEGDSNNHFNEVIINGSATVEKVLNEVIRKNPRYQWIIEDGVINIIPKKEFRHLVNGKDPLDTIIEDFTINEMKDLPRDGICNAAGLNCLPRDLAGIRELCIPISLHLRKVTLRAALNKIIKADGMASWKFEYYGDEKQPFVDIHCWRPGPKLIIEKDPAKLKWIMEEATRPMPDETGSPAARTWWYLLLLSAAGLLIFYFIVRTFRVKIKSRGQDKPEKHPNSPAGGKN